MSRLTPIRPFALLALFAVVFATAACGGGGKAGTPADDDLAVTFFDHVSRTDVYRNQPMRFEFTAPIDPASLSDRTVMILTGPSLQEPVQGALYLEEPNVVVFDPTRTQAQVDRLGPNAPQDRPFGLSSLANYQVRMPAHPTLKTLRNLSGDPLVSEYVANFSTGEDYMPELDPPSFIGVDGSGQIGFDPTTDGPRDPVLGQTEVLSTADVVLVFDEPILPESMDPSKSVVVRNLDLQEPVVGGPRRVPGTLEASTDGKVWRFVPSFGYGVGPYRIRVEITQDVKDLSGNPLSAPVTRYFQTKFDPDAEDVAVITETFNNNLFLDVLNTTGEWNSVTPGRLQGGAITSTSVTVAYTADGVNSQRHGVGNPAFRPVDFPLVAENANSFCPGWPNGLRMQSSYKQEDIGSPGAITQIMWGPASNALFAATHPSFKMRLGHTKDSSGGLGTRFDDNFVGGPPAPHFDGIYDIPQRANIDPNNPNVGFWPFPTLTNPFEYDGSRGLVIDFQVLPAQDCQYLRFWFHGTGANFPGYPGLRNILAKNPNAEFDDFTGGGQPLVFDMQFVKKRRTTTAQSRFYNTNTTNPDFASPIISPAAQPGGAAFTIEWQGANSPTDTPDKMSNWSADINVADGYRYIRFRVRLISNLISNTVARIDEIRIPFSSQ